MLNSDERRRQAGHTLLYLLPTVIGSIVPLATLPVLTRILSPAEYGVWGLSTVYASFATGIANFGLTLGYERNYFQHEGSRDRGALLYSVLAFVTATFIAVGAITWIARGWLAAHVIGDQHYGTLLFCGYCGSVVTNVKAYYLIYFRNQEDARAYTWFSIDETILTAVASVALVAWWRLGPLGLVLGQLIAASTVLVAVVVRVGRKLQPSFDRSLLTDALRISVPLTPRIFLGVLGSNFDKYMIGLLASTGGVGIYAIGQRIAMVAFQFMTAIENVFAPQVYKRMFALGAEGGASIGRYLTPFAYLSVGVSLGIALFAAEAISILTPGAYHGAAAVVGLLTVSYTLMFFGKMPQLTYAKKTAITSVLTLVTIAFNVGINLVFVPRWGAVGAAAGTMLAGILSGVVAFAVRQHYYRIEWENGRMIAIFGVLMAGTLIVAGLEAAGAPYVAQLGIKLLSVCAFAGLGVHLGYLSKANVRAVVGGLRGRVGGATS